MADFFGAFRKPSVAPRWTSCRLALRFASARCLRRVEESLGKKIRKYQDRANQHRS